MSELHQPVMPQEVLAYLQPQENRIYIDCTLGSGGHSQILLANCPPIKIIAFDHDQEAIGRCQQNPFFSSQPITFINDNFVNFPQHLSALNISQVDGFLFDLGVSSEQLTDLQRGFSYRQDSPLDMRMDKRNKLTAQDIINNYDYQKLVDIFSQYVKIVVRCQDKKPKKHPARRIFQALRIAVNQELINFSLTLETSLQFLNPEGRIVVISYHSLEDRIVKQTFRKYASLGFQILTKKPLCPQPAEVAKNRRARSAKMRVIARSLPTV
ncbi:30590_t:CDS:2, partial [Racocetra persica]